MEQLAKLIESLTKPRYEEDSIDRLNYHVTSLLLLAAAFTIIAKDYGGDPIQCWLPAELASEKSWEQYAEDYCFVENTYYVPLEQNIPQSEKHRHEKQITYYQWVPFTLMLQSILFIVPHVFWRMLNWTSSYFRLFFVDFQTRAVISMAISVRQMDPCSSETEDVMNAIANHMYQANQFKKIHKNLQISNLHMIFARILTKSYLSTLYLITKLLFISNAIIQFWIVSLYLGGNGYELTKALVEQRTWQTTGLFPRVTMCDFKIRAMGNIHHHTIQCVLMANMFNEKIYIALWWWLLILITLTVINFIYWFYILYSTQSTCTFLTELVMLGQPELQQTFGYVDSFVEQFGGDATLVLRLIVQNAGEMIASNVVARLYNMHIENPIISRDSNCSAESGTMTSMSSSLYDKRNAPPPIYRINDQMMKD